MSFDGPTAIAGVVGRISAIEARFVHERPDQGVRVLGQTAEFDPFGEVYQQALATANHSTPAATPVTPGIPAVPTTALPTTGHVAQHAHPVTPAAPSSTGPTAAQVAAAIDGVATVPGARSVGGYGSMSVPGSLRPFGNGRVPAAALTPIEQSGHRLFGPAAAAWDNLVTAAAADGIEMRITDSYRSYDQQVDLARRKGLYSEGGLAATPGTSNHGWGLAVDADVTDPATLEWLRANGPRFGFVEAVPREPWHWEFRPHQV